MKNTKVNPTPNGPYKVSGVCEIYDEKGKLLNEPGNGDNFLCRCGGSSNKPFCDGSHARIKFDSSK